MRFFGWFRKPLPQVNHRPRVTCIVCLKELSRLKSGAPMKHKCFPAELIEPALNENELEIKTFTGGHGKSVYVDNAFAISPETADMRVNAGDYHNPAVIGGE